MTAGSEELERAGHCVSGSGQEPNVRATLLELYDGLNAESRTVGPALIGSFLAINDLASPFGCWVLL